MAYFPMFVDLKGKQILVVGGGSVACHKIGKLLPYGPEIRVVSPVISDKIRELYSIGGNACEPDSGEGRITDMQERCFKDTDLEGIDIVIAATNDSAVNHSIYELCLEKRIPINAVDDSANCTFIFPSIMQNGNLSIGVSTGGASPAAAIYVRKKIEETIPDSMGAIIEFLGALREPIQARYPDPSVRHKVLSKVFNSCIEQNAPLSDAVLNDILNSFD